MSGNFSSSPGRLGVQAELVMVGKKHPGAAIAQRREKRTQRYTLRHRVSAGISSDRRVAALTGRSADE
jgi:hypothetical protein